jgi:hypothetical protein
MNRSILRGAALVLFVAPAAALAFQPAPPPVRSGISRAVPATRIQGSTAAPAPAGLAPAGLAPERAEGQPAPAPAPDAGADAAAQQAAADQQKKAERIQKIQQLQFNRTPSAILQAWSTPPDQQPANPPPADPAEPAPPPDPHPPPAPPSPPVDPFDGQLIQLQRDVTLGEWEKVKQFAASLAEDEGKALYSRILISLQVPVPGAAPVGMPPEAAAQIMQMQAQMQAQNQQAMQYMEKHVVSLADVMGLAAAAPHGLDNMATASLGEIARQALEQGHSLEDFLRLLQAEAAKPDPIITRRQAARVLFGAGKPIEAARFLPELAQAESDNDQEALNLLARHFLAVYEKEEKTPPLESAWRATQAVLASAEIKKEEKQEALTRSVDLAPKVREELGKAWLEESFTSRPDRGMEIIATIGSSASQGLSAMPQDSAGRLKGLELETTAAEALLASAPQRADEWRVTLTLLARNWLVEAEHSYRFDQSTSLGPRMQRDAYGNLFYYDDSMYDPYRYQQRQQVLAIRTADLLQIRPSDAWLSRVDESLRPRFSAVFAQLYLKVAEDEKAFPFIEGLAKDHPEQAQDLADEFLRVWTTNHDPNAQRNRNNPYMYYMFGYQARAEGIPLTRSKQERNLKDLAVVVARLRSLGGLKLDEDLLAKAFTTCHSAAEVYRIESIESVFGPMEQLEPKTVAALAQQMRTNLSNLWRQPAVQEENKTRRKQKDIEAEVLRGYSVARSVVTQARQDHPDEWSLALAEAGLAHDETTFQREIAKETSFSQQREEAFAMFVRAAELYAAGAPRMEVKDEKTDVYEQWMYASLGATDLGLLSEEMPSDLRQPPRIREAILALGGEAAERHMKLFANTLFTRIGAVKPAMKFRYLKAGFEVVGEHPQAAEARKIYDYYHDLVSEIILETRIDGSDVVAPDQPFGVFVNLRHTREIERESGGFGRYLQNQNNVSYSYNYGRPTANYRDKFEEQVHQALDETFEVLSVTFQSDSVNSRAIEGEYGWRYTPYAYLLLKARGPEVDKIPSMRLDLDFLDTSGYTVLPIESAAVPLDTASPTRDVRPARGVEVTQILDERHADEGKLVLEIKATAQGLVPELDELVSLQPGEFTLVGVDDQGVSVSKFDEEAADNVILSERSWIVSLHAKPGLEKRPTQFEFAGSARDDVKLLFQRYVDADLKEVEQVVALEERYAAPRSIWPWVGGGAVGLFLLSGLVYGWRRWSRGTADHVEAFRVPDPLTPFTVLGLLNDIDRKSRLAAGDREDLLRSIHDVEQSYFDRQTNGAPDLAAVADEWVRRAANGRSNGDSAG